MNTEQSIKSFLEIADYGMIEAVKKASREKFPKTVEAFDAFSAEEVEVIRFRGLRALPESRLEEFRQAMRSDNFYINMAENHMKKRYRGAK